MMRTGKWDFFVSYAPDDQTWAEWIAWTLEAAGYLVLIQAWDMVPGTNWVFAVDEGIRRAERTIAVTSEAYLESDWGRLGALGAVHRDPLGRQRRLLTVRVEECNPLGPLGMITRIDVFGLPEEDARRALLDGVGQAVRGRAKPDAQTGFPGQGREARFPDGTAPNAGERRICVAFDVEDYRQLASGGRERVRGRVLAMLFTALGQAGVRNEGCVVMDRVDGLALILPAGFREPTATAALVRELCTGVARIGRSDKGQPPIRSRVSMAAGTVDMTSWTFAGTATTAAQLLVSCAQVRVAAALSDTAPNAVVVGDDIYQEAAAEGMPPGFTKIPVSEDASGWITMISGTVRAPVPAHTSPDAATLGGAVAAGMITGALAAEEWHHLLNHEDVSSAVGDHNAGDRVLDDHATDHRAGEPWPDSDHPHEDHSDTGQDTDWGNQWNSWDEDDPYYSGHGATDDGSDLYGGSDVQGWDDPSDISGGLCDG